MQLPITASINDRNIERGGGKKTTRRGHGVRSENIDNGQSSFRISKSSNDDRTMKLLRTTSIDDRQTERRGGQKTMRRRRGVRSESIEKGQSSSHDCQPSNVDRTFPRRGAVLLNLKEISQIQHRSSNQMKMENRPMQMNENFPSERTLDDCSYHSNINDIGSFCSKDKEVVHHTSQMDIVIDKERGFHVGFERNLAFIEILRTCFVDMYFEAQSKTHRRILLNTILADMYDRGFRFLLEHKGKYHIIEDEIFILKKIRSVIRKERKAL